MANQVCSQPYCFQIFGDGVSTSVSFDLKNIVAMPGAADLLQVSNPDSIYLISFVGSPDPIPNLLTLTISGSVVSATFDGPFAAANMQTQDGWYVLNFYLAFNC
jgi:hypothetical protein